MDVQVAASSLTVRVYLQARTLLSLGRRLRASGADTPQIPLPPARRDNPVDRCSRIYSLVDQMLGRCSRGPGAKGNLGWRMGGASQNLAKISQKYPTHHLWVLTTWAQTAVIEV